MMMVVLMAMSSLAIRAARSALALGSRKAGLWPCHLLQVCIPLFVLHYLSLSIKNHFDDLLIIIQSLSPLSKSEGMSADASI